MIISDVLKTRPVTEKMGDSSNEDVEESLFYEERVKHFKIFE